MSGFCNLRQDGIHIVIHIVFFYFQSKYWNTREFDLVFRLNEIYLLLECKTKIFLPQNLSQISLYIVLKSLILSYCINKPISSGKKFLAFVVFQLVAVPADIMLDLTQPDKEAG